MDETEFGINIQCPECGGTLEEAVNQLTKQKDGMLCMKQCGGYFTETQIRERCGL